MSDMQKQFEEWAGENYFDLERINYFIGRDIPRDEYENRYTQAVWQAWKASRAALVVELPTAWNASYTDKAIVMDASSVVEALEDAGVAYK